MFTESGASNSFSLSSCESASPPPPQSDDEVNCYSLANNRPKKRAGRRVFKETRHPVYRGVRRRNGDKWVCEMREPNNKNARIWLGTYPTPEMAARAHDVAAVAFRGKSACLNFADSAWRLPAPASLDNKVIRTAAKEAARMFNPRLIDQPEELVSDSESSSSHLENYGNGSTNEVYVDDEAVLGMPRLLADMAQGLLLSPPNFYEDGLENWDHAESESDHFSLWSY